MCTKCVLILGAVIVVALALRWTPGLDRIAPLVESDYCYQLLAADRLFDGLGPTSLQPVAPNQPWSWRYDWGFLTQWPVGYPVIVCAVRYLIGGTSLEAARWIAILSCAAALVGWFLWIGTLVPRGWTRWLVALIGAPSALPMGLLVNPSTDVLVIAALPYLLLLAAALPHGISGAETRIMSRRIVLLGLLSGGLFWIRYASVAVPVGIGLYLILLRRSRGVAWLQIVWFAIASLTPIALLLIVNRLFGAAPSAAATLNLGSHIEPAFSLRMVTDAWWMFTSLGYFNHRHITIFLFALWPVVFLAMIALVRPFRVRLGFECAPCSHTIDEQERRAGRDDRTHGVPSPGRCSNAHPTSSHVVERLTLSASVVGVTLLMLIVATSLFGAKYDYVVLDRYYLSIRPLYFALFVSPLLLLRSRIVSAAVAGVMALALVWTVQVNWVRAHDRALVKQSTATPYGQWVRCFPSHPDGLYSWIAERNRPGLVVVSNFHEYIAMETGIATLPIPPDPETLNGWLLNIRRARHVDQLDVLFVLDSDNRWRDYWIPKPATIIHRFRLTERPVRFDDCSASVFAYPTVQRQSDAMVTIRSE